MCSFMNLVKNCYNEYKDNTILVENEYNFLDFDIEYNTKLALLNKDIMKLKKELKQKNSKNILN